MDKRYLTAGLFMTVAMIIAVVLAYPKYQVMRLSSQLVTDKQSEFTAQNVLVQEISKLRSQQKQMTDEIASIADMLPSFTNKSGADLFVELEGIAAESGLLMDTISFSGEKAQAGGDNAPVSKKPYKTIIAMVKMKGDYRNLKNFTRLVETNKHLMDITTIGVTAPATDAKKDKGGDTAPPQPPVYAVTVQAYYQ